MASNIIIKAGTNKNGKFKYKVYIDDKLVDKDDLTIDDATDIMGTIETIEEEVYKDIKLRDLM